MARKRKKLKSWQRRRRHRIKLTLYAVVFCVLIILFVRAIKAMAPYERVDLSDYALYMYSGYNTKGSVEVELNDDMVSRLMQNLKQDYEDALINFRKCESEDYNSFYNSLNITVDAPQNLANGSKFTYTVNYDSALAKKLKLKVKNNTKEVVVTGLATAVVISRDQLFEGISLTYEGISPSLTAVLNNNTVNPYLSDIEFVIEGDQECYSEGDVVRVRAVYDEQQCLDKHIAIDAQPSECYKDYVVESTSHYIRDASELPKDLLDMAISSANEAFTSKTANEFGVRVYFEANVAPVYVNKKSTFEWVNYRLLSAYLKVAKPEIAGKNSNNYNDLDIVYEGTLTQADGKTVSVEAVVRFKDIIVNDDGTYTYDFSNPTISSCSHFDSRIKKNVIANYEKKWNIEKLKLK